MARPTSTNGSPNSGKAHMGPALPAWPTPNAAMLIQNTAKAVNGMPNTRMGSVPRAMSQGIGCSIHTICSCEFNSASTLLRSSSLNSNSCGFVEGPMRFHRATDVGVL